MLEDDIFGVQDVPCDLAFKCVESGIQNNSICLDFGVFEGITFEDF